MSPVLAPVPAPVLARFLPLLAPAPRTKHHWLPLSSPSRVPSAMSPVPRYFQIHHSRRDGDKGATTPLTLGRGNGTIGLPRWARRQMHAGGRGRGGTPS